MFSLTGCYRGMTDKKLESIVLLGRVKGSVLIGSKIACQSLEYDYFSKHAKYRDTAYLNPQDFG